MNAENEVNVPDTAVQIAAKVLENVYTTQRDAERVVAALDNAGWLHDRAEVKRLRRTADDLASRYERNWKGRLGAIGDQMFDDLRRALDAAPGGTMTEGESADWPGLDALPPVGSAKYNARDYS